MMTVHSADKSYWKKQRHNRKSTITKQSNSFSRFTSISCLFEVSVFSADKRFDSIFRLNLHSTCIVNECYPRLS